MEDRPHGLPANTAVITLSLNLFWTNSTWPELFDRGTLQLVYIYFSCCLVASSGLYMCGCSCFVYLTHPRRSFG
ncbi:hypothetical protein B0H11DRAFT_2331866, partial [Mycena galericulata]